MRRGKLREIALSKRSHLKSTRGIVALVDDEDYERINSHSWHIKTGKYVTYAKREIRINGKRHHVMMHREVLELSKGRNPVVDHKNGNGLDNQRNNLRATTDSINRMNSLLNQNNTSGLRGVMWYPRYNKWVVTIQTNKRNVFCGYHKDITDAERVYRQAVAKYRSPDIMCKENNHV